MRRFGQYERMSQPLAPRRRFLRRLAGSVAVGLVLIALSLLAGMLGYHWFVRLGWIDAYENAAMILSGMGPVATPDTVSGKLFAGTYALYSGIAVLATTAVMFAPVVHRFLHYLHADPDQKH
jgi:ABC-type Na+ efflux pump permease subunit